jgi:hypothetical protein
MRLAPIILITLLYSKSFAQIVYDSSVRAQYEKLHSKLAPHMRKGHPIEDKIGSDPGHAIFTQFELDTLNKEQPKADLQEVILTDPKTNKPFKSARERSPYTIIDCHGVVSNDTLIIDISTLWNDQSLVELLTRDSVLANYSEQSNRDTVYKVDVSDSLVTILNVAAKINRLTLNKRHFKIGNTLYGRIEMVTGSFYKKDQWEDNHLFQLRWKFNCYFKLKLLPPPKVHEPEPYFIKQ